MPIVINQDDYESFNDSVCKLLDYIEDNTDMLGNYAKQRFQQVANDIDREW